MKDTFYPYGQNDMLEVVFLVSHSAHLSMPDQIESVFAIRTVNAAKVLRIND